MLGLVPIEDQLVVEEELDGWVKVSIEEGDGYVSMDYVTLSTEFVKAESKAEEEARLAKERAAREAATKAAKANTKSSSESSGSKSYNSVQASQADLRVTIPQDHIQQLQVPSVLQLLSLHSSS